MLINCSVDSLDYTNISYSVTLVPRLEYSLNLLDGIIDILEIKRNDLKISNQDLKTDFDENNESHHKAIKLEKTILFSLDILLQIKKITKCISGVNSIPRVLPSSIPLIRTISAQLYEILPHCSQKLSELSVHLGSVVLDSAALTTTSFDFTQSNKESAILLDKVKLMVGSKLSKQYPNLDFFKLYNT